MSDLDTQSHVLEAMTDPFQRIAPDGSFLFVNPAWKEQVGYSAEEIEELNFFDLVPATCLGEVKSSVRDVLDRGSMQEVELEILSKEGRRLLFEGSISRKVRNGRPVCARIILSAKPQSSSQSRQLEQLAWSDELTGLLNRRGFVERCQARMQLGRGAFWLGVADLDGLKRINDAHGHAAGDRALSAVAEALRGAVRGSDLVARWSGDEFVLAGTGDGDPRGALRERIEAKLAQWNRKNPSPYRLGLSLGLVLRRADETLEELLERADRRMYDEKISRSAG